MAGGSTRPALTARLWGPLYLVGMAGLLYAFLSGWIYDDPFITMRYALNLSSGQGMVYNPGEHTLSTTSPLLVLALAPAGLLGANIPQAAIGIGCLALAVGGLLAWEICRLLDAPWAGFAALLLYPSLSLVTWTVSSEMPLYLALALAGLYAWSRGWYFRAGLLVGLGGLARGDGLVLAGLLVVAHAVSGREEGAPHARYRDFLVRFGAGFAAVVLPWLLFSSLYFGSPLPATLAVKQAQGRLAGAESYLAGMADLLAALARHPAYWAAGIFFLLGLFAARRHRIWLLIFAWPVAVVLVYVLFGVPSAFWYYASLAPGLVLGVGLGLEWLVGRLSGAGQPYFRGLAFGGYALFLAGALWTQVAGLAWQRQNPDQRIELYRDIGSWFSENTPEQAGIALLEVGMIGYYAHPRPMFDFTGLLHPQVADNLSPDFGYADAAVWVAERFQPDYLVLRQGRYRDLLQGYAADRCALVKIFRADLYAQAGDTLVYVCE